MKLKSSSMKVKFEYTDMYYKREIYREDRIIPAFLLSYIILPTTPLRYLLIAMLPSVFLVLQCFFLGMGRPVMQRKRLKASRWILYVAVLGLQSIIGVGFLLASSCKDEEILGLYLIIALILWVLTILFAVLNKIQVNLHNQD